MELNPKNRLVRYAYLFAHKNQKPGEMWGPYFTSLCALFWRTVGVSVVFATAAIFVIGTGVLAWAEPLEMLVIVGGVLGILIVLIGSNWVLVWIRTASGRETAGALLLKSFKDKMCPIIRFTDANKSIEQ